MDVERLARHLEREAAADRFSGSVLIATAGGVLHEAAYGLANRADGVPNRAATRFAVASAGKAFTAVAVARLAERGALDVASPAAEVLPLPLRPPALPPGVTLHHLLTHTSGMPDYFDEERLGPEAYAHLWERSPNYRVRRPSDFLPLFPPAPLAPPAPPAAPPAPGAPGGAWAYCNAGYIVLGLVLEVVSGLPYPEIIRREVFAPAGMLDSGFFPMDEVHPHVAAGYLPPAAPGAPWTSNVYSVPVVGGPDGGAQCTARDLDRFLAALAGGALLSPETLAAVVAPQAPLPDDAEDAYGYGVWLLRGEGPARVVLEGEDPGVSARALWYTESGTRAVVLANMSGAAGPVGRLITSLLPTG